MTKPQLEESVRYEARLAYHSEISCESLIKQLSIKCSLTGSDVVLVVRALVDNIAMHITSSRAVSLGEFGTISAGISSNLSDSAKGYNKLQIRKTRYTFRPTTAVKNKLTKSLVGIKKYTTPNSDKENANDTQQE